MTSLRNVTLEMSLKPFGDPSAGAVRSVCAEMFRQWWPLCRHADGISVLLWAGDGSEILEYQGEWEGTFAWAQWLGRANAVGSRSPHDPEGVGLHSRRYPYREDPPTFTYRWLRSLVVLLKEVGREVTGKPIRVGATFDPGPEFAESAFKYERHPEICMAETMGARSFVCCYARLHADGRAYAAFPEGIPEGTSFGAFFGGQCARFLPDMGFDYLWLSNGFGFGLETWGLRGAVFDGTCFHVDRCAEVRRENLRFWDAFRAACPDVPIETRGTNLSTGMDLSSDAVPLRAIYRGGYGLEPPPNSPWAALNHDFGLELTGWMSHIAEIPGETFPFRFYTHDSWWLNSPWLDRYGREPHDIYMPLSVSRLDGSGRTCRPTSILFLTVDDSYGRMPEEVPNEVIPHVLRACADGPDAPGPLVWVYPFDEYHDWTFRSPARVEEVFFGDWFMRGAVNQGLPLNTVVSTSNLVSLAAQGASSLRASVLVSPVPEAGSAWEDVLLTHVCGGGRALLYGPLSRAGEGLGALLGLVQVEVVSGRFTLDLRLVEDRFEDEGTARVLEHPALLSAGGLGEARGSTGSLGSDVLATASREGVERVVAARVAREDWQGGGLVWVRGTVACDAEQTRGHLLRPLDPEVCFPGESLMRYALQALGMEILSERVRGGAPVPMTCIARHANAYMFSGFLPETTASLHLRFPQGAPLMVGWEARLVAGRARYTPPKAWHRECRVFVEQSAGVVGCREVHSGMVGVKRRLLVTGLNEATVRFCPEPGSEAAVRMLSNGHPPYLTGDFVPFVCREVGGDAVLETAGVTGSLLISW